VRHASIAIGLLVLSAGAGCRSQSASPATGEHAPEVPDPFLAAASAAVEASGPTTPGQGGDASAKTAVNVVEATIRLLDAGRPPRRRLRYAWRPGRTETLAIVLRTTALTESEGEHPTDVALPSVRIAVDIDPREVTPTGELTYVWHVAATKVLPAPGASPQLAEGMAHEVAAIAQLSGTADVAPNGLAKQILVDAATIGDVRDAGASGEMVDQIRQTLTDLETPLPEEEVGVGARWEKVARLAARSAVITQSETFTLASIAGDRGAVDDVLAQTAPPQDFPAPGAGAGQAKPARLESMLATGTAKALFDLTRIVPSTSYSGTTTMVVSGAPAADASRRVTMTLRVDIVLSGSTP
jgi:hypothetical protein